MKTRENGLLSDLKWTKGALTTPIEQVERQKYCSAESPRLRCLGRDDTHAFLELLELHFVQLYPRRAVLNTKTDRRVVGGTTTGE